MALVFLGVFIVFAIWS